VKTLTPEIIGKLEKTDIIKNPIDVALYNYPPSSLKTYSYLKIRYEVKAKNYFGSCEIEGEPIYLDSLSADLREIAVIYGSARRLLLKGLI
jgi:hypothetical protein